MNDGCYPVDAPTQREWIFKEQYRRYWDIYMKQKHYYTAAWVVLRRCYVHCWLLKQQHFLMFQAHEAWFNDWFWFKEKAKGLTSNNRLRGRWHGKSPGGLREEDKREKKLQDDILAAAHQMEAPLLKEDHFADARGGHEGGQEGTNS